MTKEEQKNLIAGRIIDEYHKHKSINWHEIAASKIHTQWFEYFDKEIKQLREEKKELLYEISELTIDLSKLENENNDLKQQYSISEKFRIEDAENSINYRSNIYNKLKNTEKELELLKKNYNKVFMDVLAEYDKFLLEHGYTDADVWAEEPTAADRFTEYYKKK